MEIIEPGPPTTSDFFTSIWKSQTWLNIAYLFISFPIGLISFLMLIIGLSLGFGLLITVFGIFILMFVLVLVHWLARFEASLASTMLGLHISPPHLEHENTGFWKRFKNILRSPLTWKGLFFQFLRFPLGIFSFSLTIALLTSSLALIATPFIYRAHWFDMQWNQHPRWVIDTLPEALGSAFIGLILLYLSLYVLNWVAWVYGKLAKVMLGE